MPISGGGSSSNLSDELIEKLVEALSNGNLGGLGIPAYRYVKGAKLDLKADTLTLLLDATPTESPREVNVFNRSTTPIDMYWVEGSKAYYLSTLQPGNHFHDKSDGGMRLEARAPKSAKLEIIIRSVEPINYEIGETMVLAFPVGVSLHIGTGSNFDYVSQSVQDATSSIFNNNIRQFFDSDDGVTGWKLAAINSFTPGEEIEFTVTVEGSRYQSGTAIQFQYLNLFNLSRLLLAVGSDVINPENEYLDSSIAGIISQGKTGGECDVIGGAITIRPNFLNMIGRFVAVNPSTGAGDTAIIKLYTPNSNPLLGGTFVLEGF
ncbi:MAG: hypothetical protein AAFO04_29520 [Cyanobacteria bacterium J06592_8]